ncbi:MAG: hypothetical protein H0T42_14060 [Deltaproteobacteria bacterium]|nr:hypothetical protein [Deltaproteobacteria bacterium]
MQPILDGVDDLIDEALQVSNVGAAPHYKHKTSWNAVASRTALVDWHRLLERAAQRIQNNWDGEACRGKENWRFTRNPTIDPENTSPEKRIEKGIVVHCGDSWANQVPTCSGVNNGNERHRCIDLAFMEGARVELIELKDTAGNNPLFTAIEVLIYGLVYRFSRVNRRALGYSETNNPLMFAPDHIELKVLAPTEYYRKYDASGLAGLESGIKTGLGKLLLDGYGLTFGFEQFDLVHEIADGDDSHRWRDMIKGRRPVHL